MRRMVGRWWYVVDDDEVTRARWKVGGDRRASAAQRLALPQQRAPCAQRAGAAGWCSTRTVQRVPDRVMLERQRRAKGERDGLDWQAEIEAE